MRVEGWPRCALCDKPVAEVATQTDPLTGDMWIAAECHGKRQVVKVPAFELVHEDTITLGTAFNGPAALTR